MKQSVVLFYSFFESPALFTCNGAETPPLGLALTFISALRVKRARMKEAENR